MFNKLKLLNQYPMHVIKKYLGFLWILLAFATIGLLLQSAYTHIKPDGKLDINKPMPWMIIITVFIPIAVGLGLFGWYALKGEYDTKEK
jgi:hypothetical protein